jgi:hypothetical protein
MRRLFWLSVGAAAGATGTIWTQRKVREQLDELGPEHAVVVAGRGARAVGRRVVDAVGEGRSAMAEREVELRERFRVEDGASSPRAARR